LTTFAELGLAPDILRALDDLGYATPTPIQEQVIPLALQGGDIPRRGADRHRQDGGVCAAD